jgi:hypothetical protein
VFDRGEEPCHEDDLAGVSTTADPDLEFVERRREVRVVVRIPGQFTLASRRDRYGNRRRFACRAVNISQSSVLLATSIAGPIGERVIAYFQEFGKIQGSIIRVVEGGFVIRIAASSNERSRLLRKLIWLEQNKNYDIPDVRTHKRVIPEEPISTLTFPDGSMLGCSVIDMSASGVAVSADVIPEIGTVLAIGKVTGTVVRHFEDGFAVQFKHVQNANALDHSVVYRF